MGIGEGFVRLLFRLLYKPIDIGPKYLFRGTCLLFIMHILDGPECHARCWRPCLVISVFKHNDMNETFLLFKWAGEIGHLLLVLLPNIRGILCDCACMHG